jgi:mRNA interferase RelE/StbE
MAFYKIELMPSVHKDFMTIQKTVAERVWEMIESLAEEPLPRGVIKLTDSENLYRVRLGNFRIIYSVDHTARQVLIHYIRHRQEVYRTLR